MTKTRQRDKISTIRLHSTNWEAAVPIQINSVKIMDDTLRTPVNQVNTVLGWNIDNLNVLIQLDGDVDAMPDELPIEVMSQEPKLRRKGMSSMTAPFKTTAKRGKRTGSPWSSWEGKTYRVTIPTSTLAPLMKRRDDLKKVATVVRHGGESAMHFRSLLANSGWAVRGAAKQPAEGKPDLTGDVNDDQPDARTLYLSGGVEILEVSVPALQDLKAGPHSKTWMFVHSPTDVLFYSGHGAWWDCNLLLEAPGHLYQTWITPEETVASWQAPGTLGSPLDPNVLIINGCSVICDLGASQPESGQARTMPPCVERWRKLLKATPAASGGPLTAILGYRDTAPLDSEGGTQIAISMAQAIINSPKAKWED